VNVRQFFVVAFLLANWFSYSTAAELKEIVWDGFAFPAQSGQVERCDVQRNPMCLILESGEEQNSYSARFSEKIKALADTKYRFVDYASASDALGDTLHLAVSIGLEWPISDAAQEKENLYLFCATILLYKSAETLTLLSAKPLCFTQAGLPLERNEMKKFLTQMLYASTQPRAITIEKRILSEISEVINARPSDLKRFAVRSVKINGTVFKGDPTKRAMLRDFIAESLSASISEELGKPIIPASLTNGRTIDLRFQDLRRSKTIELPVATDFVDVLVQPFSKKIKIDNLGYKYEMLFSILAITHQKSAIGGGGSYFNNLNLFSSSAPRRLTAGNESELDELRYLNIVRTLTSEISKQFVRPDKTWVADHTVGVEPGVAFDGLSKLSQELNGV
jgi:hypothetical protein